MKYLDSIKVITNKYEKEGIKKGTVGTIILPEIRNKCFECEIFDVSEHEIFLFKPNEIEVIKNSNITDIEILEVLPKNDPHWWCKVEDGYIKNLLGEKKNKIPFDYDS